MDLNIGCRVMAPLSSCQVCPPTEELQSFWVGPSQTARRMKQKKELKSSVWSLASWNVRSLLDVEGSLQTARSRDEVENAEYRQVDRVVSELQRYGVAVAWLQETKWFGAEAYRVGESVVLTAGRPVPGVGQPRSGVKESP